MMRRQRLFYCTQCGQPLHYRQQQKHSRLTCRACSCIHYENPIVGVAAVILNRQKEILLGQRSRGPYRGLWCIPCGYLEYEEDVYQGVRRECKEETNLDIEVVRLLTVQSNFHDPDRHTVGIWFIARVTGGELMAGDDLERLAYFPGSKLPRLAFPTDRVAIKILYDGLSG